MAGRAKDWAEPRPLPAWAAKKPRRTGGKHDSVKGKLTLGELHPLPGSSSLTVNPDGTVQLDHKGLAFHSAHTTEVTAGSMWRMPGDIGEVKRSAARAEKIRKRLRGAAHVSGLLGAATGAGGSAVDTVLGSPTSAAARSLQEGKAAPPQLPPAKFDKSKEGSDGKVQLLLQVLPEHMRGHRDVL